MDQLQELKILHISSQLSIIIPLTVIQENSELKRKKKEFENICQKLTTFLKTLEMLALHWKVINPNKYRYRLKKIIGMKKEFSLLPKFVKESYYFNLKTFQLSCKVPVLRINSNE